MSNGTATDDKLDNENESNEERAVMELRKLMQDDQILKNLKVDNRYLSRFLNCADYDAKTALDRVHNFYDTLTTHPNWFTKLRPTDKKAIIEKDIRILIDRTDKEGRPIYIIKLGNMDPSVMDLIEDVVAVDDFFVEALFLSDGSIDKGLCVIVDISNFSLKLMKWLTPGNIKIAVKRILSMPIKEFHYHVVNSSLLINVAIKIVWPFLPQQIKEAVKFHFSDFESLYRYVDKESLPKEYGGDLEVDYDRQRALVYEKNSEIYENFRANRMVFLDSVQTVCLPSED
ncbi:unnamed protein product [Phyllotreta striolata]|uniref:CRAL-TRIO domain-containing protein n=1 Tax=Phyllotreta striolata TaxID=444603 RepID=A0A9N9TYI2_PHYSR|nr:unnamed protein product [Phyllotreta striolata]